MNTLKFKHPDISQNQFTALSSQANSGDATLNVVNSKGFAVNKLLLVGVYGSGNVEIAKTHASTAPTDILITLAAVLGFAHTTDTQIIEMDYDQIEISKATAKGGTYSIVATINITPDEDATSYKDATGSGTDYYKIRYKNSIDNSFSGYSVEIPAAGFADNTLSSMIDEVLRKFAKQSSKIITREEVTGWLNEGQRDIAKRVTNLNLDYYIKHGTDGNGGVISFVANQRSYDIQTLLPNFYKPRRFYFSYDNIHFKPANKMDRSYDYPDAVYDKTYPRYYFENRKIVPKPTPTSSSGGILADYAYLPDNMVNDDDTPDIPFGYHDRLVDFGLKCAFEADQKIDLAEYYGQQYENGVALMVNELQPRSPELPDQVEMWGEEYDQEYNDGFIIPS